MSAPNVKRSVVVNGHATSITLEEPFWQALRDIAEERGLSLNALVSELDAGDGGNLSGAIRVYVLEYFRARR